MLRVALAALLFAQAPAEAPVVLAHPDRPGRVLVVLPGSDRAYDVPLVRVGGGDPVPPPDAPPDPVGPAPTPRPPDAPEPAAPDPPAPDPSPQAPPEPATAAARAYRRSLAKAYRDAAAAVRDGRARTQDQVIGLYERDARAAVAAFGAARDAATLPHRDNTGAITDPAAYAARLEAMARGMDAR